MTVGLDNAICAHMLGLTALENKTQNIAVLFFAAQLEAGLEELEAAPKAWVHRDFRLNSSVVLD